MEEDIREVLEQRLIKIRIANESVYWSISHIACVLDKSESQVKRRVLKAPGFPAPIRKQQADGSEMGSLYVAQEVRDWIESDRDLRISA